ncbi:universal stress protein [Cognatiluteimonas profundi]|uniref:universal stress protein n=1 Tax=Cognatiluteimonas profundi TaxID=2594501 RepID=UPI00131D31AC|nr:universal stress protein [Lysobacter profundi]
MFKDILLPMLEGDIPESALHHARVLAEGCGGRVTALVAVSAYLPASADWVRRPLATYETLHQAATSALAEQVRNVEARLARETVQHEVRGSQAFWSTPAEILAAQAHIADLIVLEARRPLDEPGRHLFAGALIGSGRPVLLVPASDTPHALGRVLVAWKPSREAARALHDAMPLLQAAARVDVLIVDRKGSAPADGDSDAMLIEHLRRRAIEATLVHQPCTGASTGETIAAYAAQMHADLIVSGGYGRSRALEQVFGGVTRFLLEHATIPVLFSH